MKSLFDWRATALALVLAVAAALPSMTTSVVRRDYYLFDVTLTSTAPGTTQLFWDLGRGYNENDSSRQPLKIEPKPVRYRYMMPMGDIKALRFDPNNAAIWSNIGKSRYWLKQYDGAREAWQKALQLDPGRADALAGLNAIGKGP